MVGAFYSCIQRHKEKRLSFLWWYTEDISDIFRDKRPFLIHLQHLFQPHPKPNEILHGKFLWMSRSTAAFLCHPPGCTKEGVLYTKLIIWKAISSEVWSPCIVSEICTDTTWLQTHTFSLKLNHGTFWETYSICYVCTYVNKWLH